MAKKDEPAPVARIMKALTHAIITQVMVRLCDLDRTPSIYSHRDPGIYVYKPDDENNRAKFMVESLVAEGQKAPIAFADINGVKVVLGGHRRQAGLWTAVELQIPGFHPEMEILALQVVSDDPLDYLEFSITDNAVRRISPTMRKSGRPKS